MTGDIMDTATDFVHVLYEPNNDAQNPKLPCQSNRNKHGYQMQKNERE
jgi:hypothetical protein